MAPINVSSTGAVSTDQLQNSSGGSSLSSLTPQDFIQMMVTQLQNQDPLQPTSSDQLLSQMSEIGQLQSSTSLTTSLQGLVLQNQIGSASALIGKSVQGLDSTNTAVSGTVSSVQVTSSGANLQLDSGSVLPLSGVTSIAPASTTTTPATGSATTSSGVTGQ